MPDLKAIKLALKFAKYARNPDKKIREEILRNAPSEIREKLNRMMDVYEGARRGEIPRDEAVKTIASEIGFDEESEIIDMIKDMLEIIGSEMSTSTREETYIHGLGEKHISRNLGID